MHALDLDGMLRRLHLPTVRRLYPECELRAETEDQSYRDFLATLIAEEVAHRAQTRIERSVRKARFPFLRTIEDFDFTFQTSIRLQLLGSYLGPELVTEGRSLILYGPTGTGKTHLGIAIAYRAIQNGYEARFTSAAEMIETLAVATRRGELAHTLAHYTHPPVLVIDEVGYLAVGSDAANLMFQVVNERYLHRRPMLFTTNKPLAAWGLVLHDPDLAEVILDRVLERGRLVELRGASYRTRHLKPVHRSSSSEVVRISGNQRSDFPEPTEDDDVARLVGLPEAYGFVIRLGLASGLRWSEMWRAQAKDIRDGVLTVHQTKSGKVRRVPLPSWFLPELRERVGRLVAVPDAPTNFMRIVRRLSGVEKFHPHLLRHTYAPHLCLPLA